MRSCDFACNSSAVGYQEKGLLRDFYRKFRDGRTKDPSGYATLTAVLGERDMVAFQKRWQAYVAKLTFP